MTRMVGAPLVLAAMACGGPRHAAPLTDRATTPAAPIVASPSAAALVRPASARAGTPLPPVAPATTVAPADRFVLDELDRVRTVLAAYAAGPELVARLGGSFDARTDTGITITSPPVFASLEVWPVGFEPTSADEYEEIDVVIHLRAPIALAVLGTRGPPFTGIAAPPPDGGAVYVAIDDTRSARFVITTRVTWPRPPADIATAMTDRIVIARRRADAPR